MSYAPAPSFTALESEPVLRVAREWTEHYNACATCQRDSWDAPHLGEPYFCSDGRERFLAWIRMTRIRGANGYR